MARLRDRLVWHEAGGALFDGPRRYLMMRPDVLMGALAALDDPAQRAWLDAWAASTTQHGGESLKAYAEAVAFDADALMTATVQAAADLGWGVWQLTRETSALHLTVTGSPFVDGWRAATPHAAAQPVCAPVSGMLQALAALLLPAGPLRIEETACAAMQPSRVGCQCHFTARVAA
jgi:uncharacterized protein